MKNQKELFASYLIIADIGRKKLLITKKVIENRHKLASIEAEFYFSYKKMYPDYEEVIIPNFKPISLNKTSVAI